MKVIRTEKFAKYSPIGDGTSHLGPSVQDQRNFDGRRDDEGQGTTWILHRLSDPPSESEVKDIWSDDEEEEEGKKKKNKKDKKGTDDDLDPLLRLRMTGEDKEEDNLTKMPQPSW